MTEHPIGYSWLIQELRKKSYKIIGFPISTFLNPHGRNRIEVDGSRERRYLRHRKPPQANWEHLIFALTHEGMHIPLIWAFFDDQGPQGVLEFLKARNLNKYERIIWFLYENLMEESLPLEAAKQHRYVPLLADDMYYTGSGIKLKRYKIIDNRLGHSWLSPFVRKVCPDDTYEHIRQQVYALHSQYPDDLMRKSVQFLYTKETKSSYQIEREHPDRQRQNRFINLLKHVDKIKSIDRDTIIQLQNTIVDPRYAVKAYRDYQNYIGSISFTDVEVVHYICPRGEDINPLMTEFEKLCADIISDSNVNGIVAAVVVAFLFVYLHPVEDGNGRIHRFLLHYILHQKGFTPPGSILPVSAVILRNMAKYDEVLEVFSQEICKVLDHDFNDQGEMEVKEKRTRHLYLGIDLTEALRFSIWLIHETLENDFKNELDYMQIFAAVYEAVQEVVDMPNRKLQTLTKLLIQGQGKLSQNKRRSMYGELTDAELGAIEQGIRDCF